MAPWKLPLIVAAIVIPIVAAFGLGGGGAGVAVGALAAVAVVVVAARQKPRGPIGVAEPPDGRRRVLVVVTCPVEEPAAVAEIAHAAGLGDGAEGVDVLVLAPARIGFLDRWASDVEGAREAAQRNLVVSVAAFAKAGIAAEARVGDEDVVQAVEDQLGSFPASHVVLVRAGEASGASDDAAAEELRARLQPEFRRVVLNSGGPERRS
jgi:hypothetical protein